MRHTPSRRKPAIYRAADSSFRFYLAIGRTAPEFTRTLCYAGSVKWLDQPFDNRDLATLQRGAVQVPGFDPAPAGSGTACRLKVDHQTVPLYIYKNMDNFGASAQLAPPPDLQGVSCSMSCLALISAITCGSGGPPWAICLPSSSR